MLYAEPPIWRLKDASRYAELLERIETLWRRGCNDEQMAQQLRQEGFHSARTKTMSPATVRQIRLSQGWQMALSHSRNALELDGYLTVRGLAARLGVEPKWVYHRIDQGLIEPHYYTRHPHSQVYLIKDDPELIKQLQQLLAAKRQT